MRAKGIHSPARQIWGRQEGSSIQGATARAAAGGGGCSPEPKTSSESTESARGSSRVLIGSSGRRRRGLCGNKTAAPAGGSSGTAEQRASTGAGKPSPPGSGRLERPALRARLRMSGRRPRSEASKAGGTEGAVSTCCFIDRPEPPPVTSRPGPGWRRVVTTPKSQLTREEVGIEPR